VSSFKNVGESQILTPDALARAQSSYHKKRNLDKLDHFSNTQENIANNEGGLMNFGNPNDDKASILTVDRLRKFNDINGYEHGPAAEPEGAGEENDEENRDKVEELATPMRAKGGRKYLNGKSVTKSTLSRKSGTSSIQSSVSRVFLTTLQKELDEEKRARQKIEEEI